MHVDLYSTLQTVCYPRRSTSVVFDVLYLLRHEDSHGSLLKSPKILRVPGTPPFCKAPAVIYVYVYVYVYIYIYPLDWILRCGVVP